MNQPDSQAGDEQVDKSGVEYNIIIELTEWRALSNIAYRDFHGQEVGEDPKFDRLEKREQNAYKALIAKIGDYAERLATERAVAEQAQLRWLLCRKAEKNGSWTMDGLELMKASNKRTSELSARLTSKAKQ